MRSAGSELLIGDHGCAGCHGDRVIGGTVKLLREENRTDRGGGGGGQKELEEAYWKQEEQKMARTLESEEKYGRREKR